MQQQHSGDEPEPSPSAKRHRTGAAAAHGASEGAAEGAASGGSGGIVPVAATPGSYESGPSTPGTRDPLALPFSPPRRARRRAVRAAGRGDGAAGEAPRRLGLRLRLVEVLVNSEEVESLWARLGAAQQLALMTKAGGGVWQGSPPARGQGRCCSLYSHAGPEGTLLTPAATPAPTPPQANACLHLHMLLGSINAVTAADNAAVGEACREAEEAARKERRRWLAGGQVDEAAGRGRHARGPAARAADGGDDPIWLRPHTDAAARGAAALARVNRANVLRRAGRRPPAAALFRDHGMPCQGVSGRARGRGCWRAHHAHFGIPVRHTTDEDSFAGQSLRPCMLLIRSRRQPPALSAPAYSLVGCRMAAMPLRYR